MKCQKIFRSDTYIHIFFHKGMLRAYSGSELSKMTKSDHTTILRRLERGWTYYQILGEEPQPEEPHLNRNTQPIGTRCKQMPKGTKEKQNFIRLMALKK